MIDIAQFRPTGTCFDDALDFVSELLAASTGDAKLRWIQQLIIVHGICITPDGEPYAHAWVEHLEKVWQGTLLQGQRAFYPTQREKFYEERRVMESTRYTVREAMRMNEQHDNFGPWEERYLRLVLPRR